MEKVLVAMSGGVDSAAAAGLLKEQGYQVAGATMLLQDHGRQEALEAETSARAMGLDFWCFDLREAFRDCVILPFCRVYTQGGTPNPCVRCNNTLKFGLFLDKALELGFDKIATGHYARVSKNEASGRYEVAMAADRSKDQTYMLHGLSQQQLSRVILPLGGMRKEEVRKKAQQLGLSAAGKQDSQDICFIPDGDYLAYLMRQGITPRPGRFVEESGRDLGSHGGFEKYTIGQRRGLDIAYGSRIYVVDKKENGDVVVGPSESLFSRRVLVKNVNYIPVAAITEPVRIEAKLRYTPQRAACTLHPTNEGCELCFDEPQRAVTPGQSAVFYCGERLLGGGEIVRGLPE